MRIMAHLSGDEGLIQAYQEGEDLHRFVGSHVFGVEPAEVTSEMRSKVKAMSYGLAYGLSSFGLSKQLKISVDEARTLMKDYFARFGAVRDYLRAVVDQARKDGYTETIFGRRRYLPELASDNRQLRDIAERAALNAPIQGSAADIIKRAMLGVEEGLAEAGLKSRMLLQVHDELVLEVAPGELEAGGEDGARKDGRGRGAQGAAGRSRGHRQVLAGRGALMPDGRLRIEEVPVERGADTGTASAAYAAWLNSVWEGFYRKPATEAQLEQMLQSHLVDARMLTGVWDDSRPGSLMDPLVPVATYASFAKTLNIGAAVLPAHLVTSVTVRPTHRRRGILRELMARDLAQAKAAGYPVAALMASEATIYGRFGFGLATKVQALRLEVRFHGAPAGSVIQLAPGKLNGIAPEVFDSCLAAHRGSVGRQEAYLRNATGAWGPQGPEPEPKLRAAVYRDESGDIQGYVTYVFAGWEPKPVTLEIRDLVAVTEVARREIFRFLASHDLIESLACPTPGPMIRWPGRWRTRRVWATATAGTGSGCVCLMSRLPSRPGNTAAPEALTCGSTTGSSWPAEPMALKSSTARRGLPGWQRTPARMPPAASPPWARCSWGRAALRTWWPPVCWKPTGLALQPSLPGCWTSPACPMPSTGSRPPTAIIHIPEGTPRP